MGHRLEKIIYVKGAFDEETGENSQKVHCNVYILHKEVFKIVCTNKNCYMGNEPFVNSSFLFFKIIIYLFVFLVIKENYVEK